ncbi:hypothetical protein [Pseudomonas syringae]|uniref:hypothetical protein n=1 Tax=Pseudomonas syringae TaxID=317 RepID=UPI0012ADCADB|nr:hypothetical protein [Pseudomonas syringae]
MMYKETESQQAVNSVSVHQLTEAELEVVSGGDPFWDMGMDMASDPFAPFYYPGVNWHFNL